MLPVVEEIAKENIDIKGCKINVDEETELARHFRIISVPTFIVMKDGALLRQAKGAKPKKRIFDLLVP